MIGFGQNVNIPDANFKAYLVGNSAINTNGDTEIQVSEANAFGWTIECYNMNISDLTGIEAFTALDALFCLDNQLTSLDLSNNTALTRLICSNNQLTSLDVSNNTSLWKLICSNNQLTSLDVSNNLALTFILCYNNQLTSLDVSANLALTNLHCSGNQLTSLDVSTNTALIELGCHYNQLTSLDVSNNLSLTNLYCYNNQLTSLDVSNNLSLTNLYCSYNQLTSLDLNQNTALTYLWCNGNQLTSLDVSNNLSLTTLYCSNNQFTSLDVSNGNNTNLTFFSTTSNASLSCISVDDAIWSAANWQNIDSQHYFSNNCNVIYGCTDPLATNYDPTATQDDGSCTYPPTLCTEDAPTGLFTDDIIHSRAVINWDNMNSSSCVVDQYRIRYREVSTSSWTQKTMGAPLGSCTYGNQRVDKLLLNLTANTTYEYEMKAWYCAGGASSWTATNNFTTAANCPNVGNLAAYGATTTKATFTWDDSNGAYSFVRIKMRIDSISIPVASDWFTAGGFGVNYPTFIKSKNGLIPGETYRAQARTWCDPTGGPYKSDGWTSLVSWNQPTAIRLGSGSAIANLDIYPNPSRDIFNVSFTSETIQDFKVRILNVVGEELVNEDLQQFIGEYTKKINLSNNAKGIYLLEIETNDGLINKKLILQ